MTLGRKYQPSYGAGSEPRKVYANHSKIGSLSGCSSSISLCDMIEPPDWEEVSERLLNERDPLAYPTNDVEVCTVPKRIRTITHVLPDEDLRKSPMFVRDCIQCYTSDYTVVEYKHRIHSGSMLGREAICERLEKLQAGPQHVYEIDIDPSAESTDEGGSTQFDSTSQPSSGRQSVASISSSSSCNETLTPRGSWASLDLRSSSSDPLLPDVFEKKPLEQIDAINEARRLENRQPDLLGLYSPYLDEEEAVERRLPAEMPCELIGQRIMVTCHQLKLELDIEPLFASMALYDAKEKKKLSENFYFNLNSECTRQMLSEHVPHADLSTMSRCAIFDLMTPSPDVFLVVRLEKVLQGDVNECLEPYVKDDKNREKVRGAAQAACARLGKFRMPLAWTAVSLLNIVNGAGAGAATDGDKDSLCAVSHSSNSLDRKASSSSLEQLRRRAGEVGGSLSRKGSVERRAQPPDEMPASVQHLKPILITVTSFFKQETDKLRDEDLYKFLAEIKRPSSAPKKLKCIPGTLKIEVMPCPEEVKNGLTPELAKLHPYGDDNVRPCKEILPLPLAHPPVPHYQYRNLLLLSIRDLSFAAFTARSARNITVRVQLMSGEEQSSALPAIFGRSSCPEFSSEAFTTVLYHNKNPSLYDEIKLKLPSDLGDQHHLLFTFLHIACQRKPVAPEHEKNLETVIGYTWLPLCRSGKLTCGELSLPVMQEAPPANYSYIFPDVQLPGTRWIDNHKPIFSLSLDPYTTVHPQDSNIERFALSCEAVLEGNIPTRIGISNMEAELRASISELPTANVEVMARYLPVVCNKLLHLLVAPPSLCGQQLNIAQDVFTCLTQIFTDITNMNEGATCDAHGRSTLITTYIQYQCCIARPAFSDGDIGLPLPPTVMTDGSCKILHEELALQWVVASGSTRDLAMHNSWALFELIVKSMVEYLHWSGSMEAPRKVRFPEHLTDDLTTLVNNLTAEIISRYGKSSRLTQSLNNSLAFFLFDLLSIMDRGYVFSLIRGYCKQMSAKIASLPDAVPLLHYKLSFLRIICSHEHYISLNLPLTELATSGAASPAPSAHSHASSSGAPAWTSLGHEYRARHYLSGLLLAELQALLDMQSPVLQCAAVNALLSLLWAHSADGRLARRDVQARVAALYLPLLTIVMDHGPHLYRAHQTNKETLQFDNEIGQFDQYNNITTPDTEYSQTVRAPFNSETSRNLLMCLVWLLTWSDRAVLAQCVAEMSLSRVRALLQLCDLCFAPQYQGRKEILKCAQQNVRSTTDIKSKLEDVILGQGSARSDFIMRRKAGSSASNCKRERWRKDWSRGKEPLSPAAPPPALSATLSAEVALTLLQTLETVVQTCNAMEWGQSVCNMALQVLLRALQRNQSAAVLQHMFATVRALIAKLGWGCESNALGGVCRVLLRHCAARCTASRTHASAALYALMRHHYRASLNFSQCAMLVTMSLSSLVGTSTTFSEESLRRSLKTILMYAEHDTELHGTSFCEQVKDLVFNLHMILSDTVKMKEFQQDPEMLLDLMHRIARGYQHSADLRLTWLNSMAQKHMERGNHTEAAMCLVHGAALVAEQINAGGQSRGAALLERVTYNALDESNTSALRSHHLTINELQALLEHAASELMTAGLYEAVNEVYKVLIPIAEEHRDYKKLANIHSKLNEAFTRIDQLHGKRVFGSYFRVSFYGSKFGDLDGQEFIYKEHALTKLPEIFSRLENFYGARFGADNVVIIKDSNTVEPGSLDAAKAHIQITYVEPHCEPHERRTRQTHFHRNYNIKRFMYATPFTADGRAHGDIAEQCKRKTILTTAHHFPYVKTRIQVVHRTQIILSPIEVAIEDIQKKTQELAAATNQEPADAKMLQMVVQGCIGTTVNQGPLELAQVFLAPVAEGTQPATRLTNKLRLCFKDFSKKCQDALKKNKNLIGSDQREYQRELERNLLRFTERLAPLMHPPGAGHAALLSNGVNKSSTEYKYQT